MRVPVLALLLLLPPAAPAHAQGLECLSAAHHGRAQAKPGARQALNAARDAWERGVAHSTGQSSRWVLAVQTGHSLTTDPATGTWGADVSAHPCRLRPPATPDDCDPPATDPASAARRGCRTFYP